MTKLVEINFTVTGTNNVPIDEITGTTLSGTVLGNLPVKIDPLPGMVNRPGFRFYVDNVQDAFKYDAVAGESLKFSSSYMPTQKRSFVFWYYCHSVSHDPGAINYIWGGDAHGFALHSDGIKFIRSGVVHTESSGKDIGWHCAVTTVDRINSRYRCYLDSSLVYSDSTMPVLTYSGEDYPMVFGHSATDRESEISLGYAATYDTELDSTTISGIYNDFIRDSKAGNEPLVVLSGIVLDLEDTPASGSPFYLIKTSDGEIYHTGNTNSNGEYILDIPFSGHYVVVATTLPPSEGARAISLTATSGGNVTYYDGS